MRTNPWFTSSLFMPSCLGYGVFDNLEERSLLSEKVGFMQYKFMSFSENDSLPGGERCLRIVE